MSFADTKAIRAASVRRGCKPPPRLSLSQWADECFYLSAESAAEPGRWRTIPYQRGPMDAITDPAVTQVTFMKSARVGYTKMVDAAIGYFMSHDPCPQLVVQPRVEDAEGFSKEEIAPMIRDCPSLASIMIEDAKGLGPRTAANTILHKRYPGGVLSIVGANSGAGFRRISRKVVYFDEVDSYPESAGADGDPIKLGIKRTEYYHDRKIIAGSTPLVSGHSRIEALYHEGDERRYYVPCPHCGHMDHLVFTERDTGGHFMVFDETRPQDAHFVCRLNGCVIDHREKRGMVERGEWRAAKPFRGHASFHVWAAYSYSPNATWGQIAQEFLDAKRGGHEQLKTFVNTVLGETWQERGEAPEWERLYSRREKYEIGTVPAGADFLTCGVDVQKDRVVYEVVGWQRFTKRNWSIDAGVIPFDTGDATKWTLVDQLLNRTFPAGEGQSLSIMILAIDSGYNTQQVYNWVRRHERNRVIAVKGVSTAKTLVTAPSAVDVTINGQRITRGAKVWPVGTGVAKSELYGWLRLPQPTTGEEPPGYCHFPEHGEEYFKQLTAEHLVSVRNKRTGYSSHEWQMLPGRTENHWLDTRVYARVAAAVVGLDRERRADAPTDAPRAPVVLSTPIAQQNKPKPKAKRPGGGFLNRGKKWL